MHIYHNLNYIGDFPYDIELIKKTYPQYCTPEHYFLENKINYPKLENGSLVEKSDAELKLEGIIPLLEGEVMINDEIVIKPKPNGFKIQWNGKEWVETATLIEQEEIIRKQIISKNSDLLQMQSAGFTDLSLERELEILRNLHMDITHKIATTPPR